MLLVCFPSNTHLFSYRDEMHYREIKGRNYYIEETMPPGENTLESSF